ncbi:unnamed protein product [Caenorhabditis sp. 36 PRJEB53466]|nr:unnamed protein product [Caenorhabditis sp. 36 PRJEB53466]
MLFPLLLLFLLANRADGFDKIQLNSTRVTNWGKWHEWARCEDGKHAHGMQIKYEPNQYAGDDSALNAIALYCLDLASYTYHSNDWIMGGEGPFGYWQTVGYCPISTAIVGFALRAQGHVDGDNPAADNFAVFCASVCGPRYSDYIIRGTTAEFGNWSAPQFCPRGFVVCGIQAQIEGNQGRGVDDTALNNVNLECCRVRKEVCSLTLARHSVNSNSSDSPPTSSRMELHSTRLTNWGRWYPWARCSTGRYAHGMQIKYRQNLKERDNTNLNAVAIFCQELGLDEIRGDDGWMSGEGHFGVWQTVRYCPARTVIIGFALRSQPPQTDGDNVAADNFAAYCGTVYGPRKPDLTIRGDTAGVGNWTADQFCPQGYVVCGIQSQIHELQNLNDDTSLNNVNLECCRVPIDQCELKHSMVPIAEFDNRSGNGTVSAKFVKKISYTRTTGSTQTVTNEEKNVISKKLSIGFGLSYESSSSVGASVTGSNGVGVTAQLQRTLGLTGDINRELLEGSEQITTKQLQSMVQDATTHERSETITFTVPAFTRVIIEQLFITCGEYRLGLAKTVSRG